MADALAVETRSRSRSKTPSILASENGGSDKKGSKKIPTISLIEEENDVVEVVTSTKSSQSSQGSQGRRTRKPKVVSSETSVTTTTVTETVKKTINGKEESSEQATSTTTSTKSAINEAAEPLESQSMFNNIFNAIKTSTPILSNKSMRRTVQEAPEVNVADHPAYKEYKEAGEYWNKYPKTDYTYSELSPHRREISNGVVAMPNMSRRSLEKYQYRVENMIYNNPAEETFLRQKFLTNVKSFAKRSAELQYDSADEVDISELRRTLQDRRKGTGNVFSQFFLLIVSYIYSGYSRTKQAFSRSSYQTSRLYQTPGRKQQQQGVFRRSFEAVKQFVLLAFSKVYLLLSTFLCFDTWILYTRSENVIENRRRKRFLLLLLILLPLLLAGGNYIYQDPPKNLSLPKITLPKLTFPKITLPSLPKLNLPSISLPDFPKMSFAWPEISFEWLKFSRPEWLKFSRPEWLKFPDLTFTLPEFKVPSVTWPTISRPEWFKLPEWSFTFTLPKVSLPSFSWPDISLPSLPSFNFDVSAYTGYVADKFSALMLSTVDIFVNIKDATVGLLSEAQIVWNENFNAVVNSKTVESVVEPVVEVVDAPFEAPQQAV